METIRVEMLAGKEELVYALEYESPMTTQRVKLSPGKLNELADVAKELVKQKTDYMKHDLILPMALILLSMADRAAFHERVAPEPAMVEFDDPESIGRLIDEALRLIGVIGGKG